MRFFLSEQQIDIKKIRSFEAYYWPYVTIAIYYACNVITLFGIPLIFGVIVLNWAMPEKLFWLSVVAVLSALLLHFSASGVGIHALADVKNLHLLIFYCFSMFLFFWNSFQNFLFDIVTFLNKTGAKDVRTSIFAFSILDQLGIGNISFIGDFCCCPCWCFYWLFWKMLLK